MWNSFIKEFDFNKSFSQQCSKSYVILMEQSNQDHLNQQKEILEQEIADQEKNIVFK
jgi:hypothetical protein